MVITTVLGDEQSEEAGVCCGGLQKWMQMDTGPDVQFGKDVIPHALSDGLKVVAFQFDGFWQVRPALWSLGTPCPTSGTPTGPARLSIDIAVCWWTSFLVFANMLRAISAWSMADRHWSMCWSLLKLWGEVLTQANLARVEFQIGWPRSGHVILQKRCSPGRAPISRVWLAPAFLHAPA